MAMVQVRQTIPAPEHTESVMSQPSDSPDRYDLPNDNEEPELCCHGDRCDGKTQETRILPFQIIYIFLPFKSLDSMVFLENVPIFVRGTEVERSTSTTRALNPNLYVELSHGDFTWKIKQRFKHFQALHQELLKFKALLKLPLPTRISLEKYSTFPHSENSFMPMLPWRPDALVKDEQLGSRKMQLEDYLRNILKRTMYRSHPATGFILKKSGGNTFSVCYWCGPNSLCLHVCVCTCFRWLVGKDSFVLYMWPKDGQVGTVILYDKGFHIKIDTQETGVHHRVTIENLCRQLLMVGVKICTLLYKEVKVTLGLNSKYTKGTCPGMIDTLSHYLKTVLAERMIPHPDHMRSTALLWVHHETTVVIDQSLAFLGGIDLAYGCWDGSQHRLTDVGSSVRRNPQPSPGLPPNPTMRSSTIAEEDEEEHSYTEVRDIPAGLERRPRRQGGAQNQGHIYSHLSPPIVISLRMSTVLSPYLLQSTGSHEKDNSGGSLSSRMLHLPAWYWYNKSLSLRSSESGSLGFHYSLPLPYETGSLPNQYELCERRVPDFIDRDKTPRMHWHSIGVAVQGKAARDVTRYFIQRWNFTKLDSRSEKACLLVIKEAKARSVSQWTIGYVHKESIHLNQLFISCADRTIHNCIRNVLTGSYGYTVYIVMPLLRGFEDNILSGGGQAIKAIMYFNYRPISFGLWNHADLDGWLVTELIYSHSKLLIVDGG
ncbi:LOW QUALITY PROTEIN: phospholipase D1 [Diretmus argenteus]